MLNNEYATSHFFFHPKPVDELKDNTGCMHIFKFEAAFIHNQ